MQAFLKLLVFSCLVAHATATGVMISSFDVPTVLVVNSTVMTRSETVTDPRVFGGERRVEATIMTMMMLDPALRLRCEINAVEERLDLSTDVGVAGYCRLTYSGSGQADIVPPLDISQTDCWLFHWLNSDNQAVDIQVTTETNTGTFNVSQLVQQSISSPGFDFCIPYPAAGLNEVTGLQIALVSAALADNSISFICAATAVSCWHSIDYMGNDPSTLQPGAMIGFSVTCLNYDSLPMTNQNIEISMTFPDVGTINDMSLTCTGALISSIVGNNFTARASLNEGQAIECSFVATLTSAGNATNLSFTVLNEDTGAISQSTADGNTVGTRAFCEPAAVSAFQVLPPSSVSGDPHFKGFQGQVYDFHGVKDTMYNIITTKSFQMNSLFYNADLNPLKNKTYLGAIGMRICDPAFKDLHFYFKCDRTNQNHVVLVNTLPLKPGYKLDFKAAKIKRSKLKNSKVSVKVHGAYDIEVRFSHSAHSSCHLNIKCSHRASDEIPHGILGQTVSGEPNAIGIGWNSPNIVEGKPEDYVISSKDIYGTDFLFNRFIKGTCHPPKRHKHGRVFKSYAE